MDTDSENSDTNTEDQSVNDNSEAVENADSNSENSTKQSECSNPHDDEVLLKHSRKRISILDSDTDEEQESNDKNDENATSQEQSKCKKKLAIIDSESEDEADKVNLNDDENSSTYKNYNALESESDHDDKKSDEEKEQDIVTTVLKSRLSTLCDPESSDEETTHRNMDDDDDKIVPIPYKKKYKKKNEEESKKPMSAKEAAKMKQEIESFSQKMIRESDACLPYHKPKQRSLKEFLQNRPKFSAVVPKEVSSARPAVAMKKVMGLMDVISKKIEEREKEVEEFFKSDSDEEKECNEKQEEVQNNEKTTTDNVDLEVPNETQSDIIENDSKTTETESEMISETNPEETCDDNNTDNYEFNLDNIADEEDDEASPSKQNTASTSDSKPNLIERIKQNLGDRVPRLSGGPHQVIDLEDGSTRPDEVSQLMDRFMKHAVKKNQHKDHAEASILRVTSDGNVHAEKVSVHLEEEAPPVHEKPGVMMKQLKQQLQEQILQKRNEAWKEKTLMPNKSEINAVCAKKIDDDDPDYVLDDEEELEDYVSDEEEAEPEDKAEFLDNEAGEDEIYEEDEIDEEDGMDAEEELDAENEESDLEAERPKKEKKLKRILTAFNDDDSDEDDNTVTITENTDKKSISLNSTQSWNDDDYMLPGQTKERTPTKSVIENSKPELQFLSPVSHLTGLQNFEATSGFLHPSRMLSSQIISVPSTDDLSPLKKPLYESDNPIGTISQNLNDLEFMCTGKFPSTQQASAIGQASEIANLPPMAQSSRVDDPNTQDLADLCSGKFTGNAVDEEMPTTQDLADICSGAFTGVPVNSLKSNRIDWKDSDIGAHKSSVEYKEETKKSQNDDDGLFSQIITDSQLEEFRKKVISPEYVQQSSLTPDDSTVPKKISFTEENDEDEEEEIIQPKKAVAKRNVLEESDEDVDEDDDDVVDTQEVAYDSEENEIDLMDDDEEGESTKRMRVTDFMEKEAELSESEWGSADEDEKDLDQYDPELVDDTTKIDQSKVRDDLERIHMRQMLDDDNREVKILQEMLLEDGELHGAGRQRQFKWRNIDNDDSENNTLINDDDDDPVEEEMDDEEQWRKKRYERELYLQKISQSQSVESDEDDVTLSANSQVLKLGQKALMRSTSLNKTESTPPPAEVKFQSSFLLNNKRGSFLSRGDSVLARVAEYTRVNETVVVGGPKNTRNFVFQSVSSSESVQVSVDKKRKAPAGAGTPMAIKKLRLTTLSPANQKKTDKSTLNSSKRLFSQW